MTEEKQIRKIVRQELELDNLKKERERIRNEIFEEQSQKVKRMMQQEDNDLRIQVSAMFDHMITFLHEKLNAIELNIKELEEAQPIE